MTLFGGSEVGYESGTSFRARLRAEVGKVVVGHEATVDLLGMAAICGGHTLLEGPPGVAKTLMAGSVARALGVKFTRIQFTPDTKPADITGESLLKLGEKVFAPGAIFTNVLLADEINRTQPRVQSALLEAMQEGHVSVDGRVHWLPSPFLVIATQNPHEHEGVYPLPESQLDRFFFKIRIPYPGLDEEVSILGLPHRGVTPDMLEDVRPLLGPHHMEEAQREVVETTIAEPVARYLVAIVRGTRSVPGIELGASPRASIHLLTAAKARAWSVGRTAVSVDDVKEMAPHVLSHRVIAPGRAGSEVVAEAIASVPPPLVPVA